MNKFKDWFESFVYHGSKIPIERWDNSRHLSGYYPGFYAWPDKAKAMQHGTHVYELEIDDSKFYHLEDSKDSEELKSKARQSGFPVTFGSGHQDVAYLKSLGYKGIKRGLEYIIFSPEEWSSTPKEVYEF